MRRALRSPLPHGVPGRTLDKTLIIARWQPGTRFWEQAGAEMLAAEILAAADLTIVGGPEVGETREMPGKPDWLREVCWAPMASRPAARDQSEQNGTTFSLWFDMRRIALKGPFGGDFCGFSVSGQRFCLTTQAEITDKGAGHPILLGPGGEGGFVAPEELADLPASCAMAVRPVRREIQILAAGRFRPDLPGFGDHAWAALEIDFRDQHLDSMAEMARPIAARAESKEDTAFLVNGCPPPPETAPTGPGGLAPEGIKSPERPEEKDSFLTALKALFWGR